MKESQKPIITIIVLVIALIVCISLFLVSKIPSENSPVGFILPPGDATAGQHTFAQLNCIQCHSVAGVTFPESETVTSDLMVPLGGALHKVKTYGQLATAIIHPSESVLKADDRYVDTSGKSLMPDYTTVMTVQQMTDIITFLQEHYEIVKPAYDPQGMGYPYY